ncbi:type VI secretion system-associated FHA domain protein TagH [Erwinia psidii]|uniref:Type VI secretion system-associated FHA domain protein TagH n=1 Tax=Erwinia psidii TaxID=69224 RepID=A0A3N6SE59_9GAMM|nr:type VI secretion system-associated FHA domain protein TagH [Erwinia psidii]MCX8959402.1 type VI secretion system-associated FHA domain protein TagH [Erwinia psidii]MCX8962658.1 type VI secretion system-associated FHA domain protein TagH [Erwinia psidii]MCX8964254.1 type VI secretion system-associated FHA domain protein TagH [Erwinia psidii]RQM36911.1 type VI secretion system-associated FHA domain protein TagH [Erwinia psidii]
MRFTIIANKPGHQPPQSSCDFQPPGGTIGRGVDNNLVLPDDDRTISRLQAIVHITAEGECRITNRGNVTLVHLNDIPLERGRQVDLQEGDILSIDEYRLQVSERSSAAPTPVRPAPVARPAAPQPKPVQAAAPAAIPSEIWDSLAEEFSISDNLSSRNKTAPASANPLTEAPAADRNPVDPLAQFAAKPDTLNFDRRQQQPDTLFNNDALFNSESIFDDSTPSTLIAQPAAKPQRPEPAKDELDPLALFGGGSAPAQVNSDDPLGLLGNAMPLTPVDESGAAPQPVKPAGNQQHPVPPAVAARDSDFDLFAEHKTATPPDSALAHSPLFDEQPLASPLFDEPSAASDHAIPAPTPASAPALPQAEELPTQPQDYGGITLPTPQAVARSTTPPPKGRLRIDPVSNPMTQQGATSAFAGEALDGELLQALLSGMGLNDLQPTPRFDSDTMQELGQMLSMFSQGTVALLSSRSILKRGVKAEMTVILDEANNPFKLLPSGKSVLMQMFGSRMPGFMPPRQSVRDALVDLQAHQLGMIAGIRAIIASMLQSFNPQQLEEEARQEGVTSRLSLPGSRKAALWEHFTKRYGETAGEIEDDFHTLFGEAFLHAYDMEVNQYKDSQIRSEE